MDKFDGQTLPAHHSAQEILAHPRFSAARQEFVRKYLALYEHNPFLNRLLLQVGRNVLFVVIMCLHARYDEDDRATWPTLRLVTQATTAQGVASARRIPGLVARLIETGYLESRPSPRDRRIRIVTPTATMMAEDCNWLVSHYLPLQILFPEPGYPGIMRRDPAFQIAQRLIASSFFALAARILAEHPVMMRFMTREAGMIILIKLIQLCDPESLATPEGVSYSDFGARFGVSRTQVRSILEDAEAEGLVRLTKGAGHIVQLTPPLVAAFDRFLAAGMSGHDMIYNLARQSLPDCLAAASSSNIWPAVTGDRN